MDKEIKRIVKALKSEGFDVATTSKGRVVVSLDGVFVTSFGAQQHDVRGIRNSLAPLKRLGFRWPPSG